MLKKILVAFFAIVFLVVAGAYIFVNSVRNSLPQISTLKDYNPPLVSQVYDRKGKKIGEFFRERRTLVAIGDTPKFVVDAFLAAEDDQFFKHGGINYQSILRATIANMRAGRTVQGGSTITQQVAKTFFLSDERTFDRKLREALLAVELEKNLSKEEILYLYLNQIYFGQGAYGIENAAQTYYQKSIKQLTVAEAAMLAGLPKAPSAFSPVKNPSRSKERQIYVIHRMLENGFIDKKTSDDAEKQKLKLYVRESYHDVAPYVVETVRQMLVARLGEQVVLDKGIKVQTGIDLDRQLAAQEALKSGLKELDKRQGFRGPLQRLSSKDQYEKFIEQYRQKLVTESTPERTLLTDGTFDEIDIKAKKKKIDASGIPGYYDIGKSYEAIVDQVDDAKGLVYLQLPELKGVIDFETMTWARKPNPEKKAEGDILEKPSRALAAGDIILVQFKNDKAQIVRTPKGKTPAVQLPDLKGYSLFELDQEPEVEGALMSLDQNTQDVLAMVGGYDFSRNEFNRALQAARQTGSSFKAFVYAAALDRGYTPSTPVMDAPLIYQQAEVDEEGQETTKTWKPANHGRSYGGEVIVRTALVRSLNIPAVRIIEDIGVPFSTEYAQRLGIFSPLNPDYTLALGSSSVTLYEMTKAFSNVGRLGKRTRPMLIKKVTDSSGKILLENVSLDARFEKEIAPIDAKFEERRKLYLSTRETEPTPPPAPTEKTKDKSIDSHIFFPDPDQLISPQTAYLLTSLLKGVVEDRNGTGGKALALGREVAGKTGTTNGYFDGWFVGYTAQVSTGVWVGYDKEKTLGRGEVGGKAALPIWVEYMKKAHESLPAMPLPIPEGIVFVDMDALTGNLASPGATYVVKQAFKTGTEPTTTKNKVEENTEFLKDDLTE